MGGDGQSLDSFQVGQHILINSECFDNKILSLHRLFHFGEHEEINKENLCTPMDGRGAE
jgi:hypothetical protein